MLLFSKGLILILFCMCGTLESADSMEPIQGRLRNLMATIEDPDTRELLEDTIALIELNQRRPRIGLESRLFFTRVCRQHFVQWDLQVFLQGPIWQSVSSPLYSDITDSKIYLFIAVQPVLLL